MGGGEGKEEALLRESRSDKGDDAADDDATTGSGEVAWGEVGVWDVAGAGDVSEVNGGGIVDAAAVAGVVGVDVSMTVAVASGAGGD